MSNPILIFPAGMPRSLAYLAGSGEPWPAISTLEITALFHHAESGSALFIQLKKYYRG